MEAERRPNPSRFPLLSDETVVWLYATREIDAPTACRLAGWHEDELQKQCSFYGLSEAWRDEP